MAASVKTISGSEVSDYLGVLSRQNRLAGWIDSAHALDA